MERDVDQESLRESRLGSVAAASNFRHHGYVRHGGSQGWGSTESRDVGTPVTVKVCGDSYTSFIEHPECQRSPASTFHESHLTAGTASFST